MTIWVTATATTVVLCSSVTTMLTPKNFMRKIFLRCGTFVAPPDGFVPSPSGGTVASIGTMVSIGAVARGASSGGNSAVEVVLVEEVRATVVVEVEVVVGTTVVVTYVVDVVVDGISVVVVCTSGRTVGCGSVVVGASVVVVVVGSSVVVVDSCVVVGDMSVVNAEAGTTTQF